jgi:hypothetical protein
METNSIDLSVWDQIMYIGVIASVAFSVLILLYHEYKVLQLKDYKEKYDYVNLHEVRYFWYTVLALVLAAAFFANTLGTHKIESAGMLWFYVRLGVTVCFFIIGYFIFYSLVRIYYPRFLEKRLSKLRSTPRVSPAGNVMRKLTQSEEEHHLENVKTEGEVHSVDYDIWIDDKTGFKKIEKYNAFQHAEECSECGYFTMKIDREEIEQAPTHTEDGLLLKHYKCSYCNHREQREVVIARLATNAS